MQASDSMADSKWQYDIILIYEIDLTTLQHDNMIISWQLHDKIECSAAHLPAVGGGLVKLFSKLGDIIIK